MIKFERDNHILSLIMGIFSNISQNKFIIIFKYAVVFCIVLIFAIHYINQPKILAGGGFGWDGLEYQKVLLKISGCSSINPKFPFCSRVATPFLAYLTGIKNPITAFMYVNYTAAIVFCLIIFCIAQECGFNFYYSLYALTFSLIPFFSPLRFVPFYPVLSDPVFLLFLSISFWLLIKKKFGSAFFTLFLSFLSREAAFYIYPYYLFSAVYLNGKASRNLVLKFSFCVIISLIYKYFIEVYMHANNDQAFAAFGWLLKKSTDPQVLISYLAALSMTAAPLAYIKITSSSSKIEIISFCGMLLAAILTFIGGGDSTRIFYSFLPIYLPALIFSIRSQGYLFSLMCMLGVLSTNRLLSKIAEPLHYMPNRDEAGFFTQFPDYARTEIPCMILCIWIIIFFIHDKYSKNIDLSLFLKTMELYFNNLTSNIILFKK